MNIGKLGKLGENMVVSFLKKQKCNIVARNYQCRFGEIDIIAETNEYILFVEVKTRTENSLVSGAEAVNHAKQKRIMLTAEHYLLTAESTLQPRFDVAEVTVSISDDGKNHYSLNYIKNAF